MTDSTTSIVEVSDKRGAVSVALVLVVVYAFLLVMAHYEPLTGDGFFILRAEHDDGHSIAALVKRLAYYHTYRNPRLGQLFTFLVYIPGPLHLILTPLFEMLMIVLVFVHAVGRRPRATMRDAVLLLCATAFCWLATPAPGHAYFYRPITTNYIFTFALVLLYFLPFRFAVAPKGAARTTALALTMLATGFPVGMFNEHTGPVAIAVAAAFALVAARRKQWTMFAWTTASVIGLAAGYQYLFFAPGLRRRVGAVPKHSVLDTVLERGITGNLGILGELFWYIGPLLLLCGVVWLVARKRSILEVLRDSAGRTRMLTMAAYVVSAFAIVGISLAAPRSHYRLAIAPSLLCAIAALGACELLSRDRIVQRVLAISALGVHIAFAGVFLDLYGDLHHDDVARLAVLKATKANEIAFVPLLRHHETTPLFYGDSLAEKAQYRRTLAQVYGIINVRVGEHARHVRATKEQIAAKNARDLAVRRKMHKQPAHNAPSRPTR